MRIMACAEATNVGVHSCMTRVEHFSSSTISPSSALPRSMMHNGSARLIEQELVPVT